MRRLVTLCCLIVLGAACSSPREPQPEILGVRLGMTRDEARARLQSIGQLEKEERRQQEVWRLADDPSYTHLIVAFDKGYTAVRYVTAVANEQGRRVRYSDVVDTRLAREETTPATRNLLDFNDVTVDKRGRVLAAYADGCVTAACVGGADVNGDGRIDSNDNDGTDRATIIRQSGGRGLFAAFD